MYKNSRVKSDNDLISVFLRESRSHRNAPHFCGSFGLRLAHGADRPLIVDESFARQLGVRSACAAHKNMEAPQSIDSGDARKWHLVTSHQSLVT